MKGNSMPDGGTPPHSQPLPLSEAHARWLEDKRKIPCELAAELRIGSKGPNLVFQYMRGETLLWRQVRIEEASGGKTFRCFAPDGRTLKEAGVRLSFWNEDSLLDTSMPAVPRIITEGQFDTASFLLAGCTHVGSVPNGATEWPDKADVILPDEDPEFAYLWELVGERWQPRGGLATAKQIILATDNDKAGLVLREKLAIRLGRSRCWYVTYPEGCKDANEVLVKHGADAVMDLVADAKPMVPNRLVPFSDIPRSSREVYSFGWEKFDEHFRFSPPQLIIVTGRGNDGKALALDTEVPTPSGWTTMGDICVGDTLYDEQGQPCRVTRISEIRDDRACYKMRFIDGTEIVADADHQWFTSTVAARRSEIAERYRRRKGPRKGGPRSTDQRHKRIKPGVVTTERIAATVMDGKHYNHAVPLASPVAGMDAILPIAPYTLGVWLGDGNSDNGGITAYEEEIREQLVVGGEVLTPWAGKHRYNITGFKTAARAIGILNNKHIPHLYQRAPVAARLALLRGLMDTDGTCDRIGRCEFTSVSERLARDVYELICGLGMRAQLSVGKATLRGRFVSEKYRILFSPSEAVFTLSRKLARQQRPLQRSKRSNHRSIVSCERVPSVPVRCIEVDSPSHLFLVTRSFIPTHNSQWVLSAVANLARLHGLKGAILQFEDDPERAETDLMRYARAWAKDGRSSVEEAAAWVKRMFITIAPSEDDSVDTYDLKWLDEAIHEAVTRHGCRWIVIDPWNEIEHLWGKQDTEATYLNRAIKHLKTLIRRYKIGIFVVNHPTKEGGKMGSVKEISLYDIAGGAVWRNKADVGVIVWADERNRPERDIKVDKSKNFDRYGRPGIVTMRFVKEKSIYECL